MSGADGPVALDSVILAGNESQDSGGGMYIEDSAVTITHAVFALNIAHGAPGGAIYTLADSPVVHNAVFLDNEAGSGGAISTQSGEPELDHCASWSNEPTSFEGFADPIGTGGNVGVDPGFLDLGSPDPEDWDFHLESASPLVDAGAPSSQDPDGSPADIGAYGGPEAGGFDLDRDNYPEWWQPGPYDGSSYSAAGLDCADQDAMLVPGSGC